MANDSQNIARMGFAVVKICGCKTLPNQSQTHRFKSLHIISGIHGHAFRKAELVGATKAANFGFLNPNSTHV